MNTIFDHPSMTTLEQLQARRDAAHVAGDIMAYHAFDLAISHIVNLPEVYAAPYLEWLEKRADRDNEILDNQPLSEPSNA